MICDRVVCTSRRTASERLSRVGVMSAVYSALPPDVAQRNAAELRVRRLNKPKNLWWMGMLMDLIFGSGPWVIGSAVVAAALTAIFKEVEGAAATFALFNAPVAIAAIASFSAFLLVGKQSTNLGVCANFYTPCYVCILTGLLCVLQETTQRSL